MAKETAKSKVKKPVINKIECILSRDTHIDGKLLKAGSKIQLAEKTAELWKRKNKIK